MREEKIDVVTTSVFVVPAFTKAVQSMETMTTPPLLSISGIAIIFTGIYISNRSRPKNV